MTNRPLTRILFFVALLFFVASNSTPAPSKSRIIDEVGREVVFAFPPKRIVSLAPNTTEILFSLGLDTEIVGVSSDSNFPKEASRKAPVGGYLNPDVERIVSLQPDLIIGTGAGNTRDVVTRLGDLGFPTYVIFPKTFDTILRSIDHLGQVVGREEEATAIVQGMKRRRERVVERTQGRHRPRVLFLVGESPIVTAGKGSFADDLIRLAGGDNVGGNEKDRYPRLGMEEVLQRAPDVILISAMNPRAEYNKVLQEWRRWKTIPAVRENRIHLIDSDVTDRPSPRIIEGLEEMARILHPEVFKK